jgi:hypothetical protein
MGLRVSVYYYYSYECFDSVWKLKNYGQMRRLADKDSESNAHTLKAVTNDGV